MPKVTYHENGQLTIDNTVEDAPPAALPPAKMTMEQTFINSDTGQIASEAENGVNFNVRSFDVVTVRSDPSTIPQTAKVVSTAAKDPDVDYEDPNGPTSYKGVTGPTETPELTDSKNEEQKKAEEEKS